ncbi:MAG: SusE domain-containing protein, partial [Bacteroidales bacterium]|nr:SusE domain-containing protein [Bacteroidales bacterium]
MKKFNILAAVLMAGSLAFPACEKQDNSPVMQEPTVFVLNTPAYVNTTYDLENSTSLELTCSQPDYGFTAAVTYQVEVSLTDDWTDPETTYAVLGTTYNTARINVDAADLAASLTALSGKDESEFPFITEVYVRLRASLTVSGKGEIVSNVVVLPNVRVHYALPPVNAPEEMFINGQCNGWD